MLLFGKIGGMTLRSPYNSCLTCRAMQAGLVGALTEHYGSPGRLVDYRRQFEKTAQHEGEDSIFAIALETLTVKAFGNMSPNARFWLIWDRFIAGHENCACGRISIAFHQRLPSGTLLIDV